MFLRFFRFGILAFEAGERYVQRLPLEIHDAISANSPFLRIRNESSRLQAISCFCGVSIASSASWKVPWWIAMLVLA